MVAIMGADVLMIFGGYMAAISSGHIKWLWFTVSLMIFVPVISVILTNFRIMVQRSHASVGELYNKVICVLSK